MATQHDARVNVIVGDDLLKENFPLVHAVGRAAARPPRLIDLTWGEAHHPRVTLVGKGVCFDSGGLDIKPDASMLNMKKGHGRRGDGAGAGAHDHVAQAQGAAAGADPGGGEFDLRRRFPPARHL